MHTYTDAHIHRCTHTQIHTYTDTRIHRCTHTQMHTYTDASFGNLTEGSSQGAYLIFFVRNND